MARRDLSARLLKLAAHPRAAWLLAGIAFLESSIFPVPPDALLVPMGLLAPGRVYRLALICTLASVGGAFLGYAIGFGLYASIGQPIITAYHLDRAFADFQAAFQKWGIWLILLKGLTPIPFKLVTLASGVVHLNVPLFALACLLTRGGRFFLEAFLIKTWGPRAQPFIEKRLPLLGAAFLAMVLGGVGALFFLG
ncbi:MAG TPA: YqaA family protein [Dongiaceae bacterium]|jgi:membrane protein YqaA with SNARE-associated domain|nr:YqaA family protein [Dongiaceae bacterium]